MRGKEGLFFPSSVVPAQAGTPLFFLRRRKRRLDPRLRGDDGKKGWALLLIALGLFLALLLATPALAQTAAPDSSGALTRALGDVSGDGRPLSLSLQILILMSLLTVLPSLILMMTSFTRIIIVLSLLRQALGLQQTPPNQVLVGLALFLSLFVMRPAVDAINNQAMDPYGAGQISIEEAISRSGNVLHGFMARQTRETDLKLFSDLAEAKPFASAKDIPFSILLPAFVTSELKTAFQIGFLIFLPFLIIDLIVASTLMALGMMMLSPTIISMPFKLLLFVLVDGWALTMGSLAGSFAT
ncbi:MAG TPA: flagellar type III secretion system pore protein FliP [Rhizorhapis sp.]|nr:flagellar type III secretion system pore protein FliP [Rhizorhapis sp.]